MTDTLIMFGASWCVPCKLTRPVVERVAQQTGAAFEYVDVTSGDERAHNVLSVPTLRVYDVSGTPVAEHVGRVSAEQVRALIA
jgi:thiol-disulfide isomerase/thioredoxin